MRERADRPRFEVALFCGGRGSASIIRALLDDPDCRLTLLINGFDDGRSTGLVRQLIPGMLGPSDFRKNLATVLDIALPTERGLERLLEHRFGTRDQLYGGHGLYGFTVHGDASRLTPPLTSLVSSIDPSVCTHLRAYLRHALGHLQGAAQALADADVALGNLALAGIFLQTCDFNAALGKFGKLGRARARIVNVSDGVGRWLVALKDDGELLSSESAIVAPQSAVPIRELYLLPRRLDACAAQVLATLPLSAKHAWLAAREVLARPSDAALSALAGADLIVFGPGTQHSSLLPSYRIVAEAIGRSPAIAKVLVVNLGPDFDDAGSSASELICRALRFMGDSNNQRRSITHAVVDVTGPEAGGLHPGAIAGMSHWRGMALIWKDWRDRRHASFHDGIRVARELKALLQQPEARCEPAQ